MSLTVLGQSRVKARKLHHCMACGISIEPGETHLAQRCAYDGRAYTWRECVACSDHWADAHNRYHDERDEGWRHECGCPLPGEVSDG